MPMKKENKTKKQNINGMAKMQQRIAELEKVASERKQIEEKLQASETRYRRLFETAQDGILILDAETGNIVDVNPFLIDMLSYSFREFIGKKLWEIGSFKDIEESKAAFTELQSKEYIRYDNLPLETKDGRRINVEFVSNVYQVNHTKVIQCNIRDITPRIRVETERENLIRELKKALSEIKTLSGLLPICAHCKKIRNDEGYWEQIEGYIKERSLADFSHSICPECTKIHFPDYCKR
jgi:PAS domain S-box-containing protein